MATQDVLSTIVRKIETLPTLPTTFAKINNLMQNPKTSANDVSDVVSRDQVITARLLKLVNSSFYGFPGRITTVSSAVVILGFIVGGLAYSGVTPTNSAFCRAYFGPAHYPVNFPLINSNLIFASFGSTISGARHTKLHAQTTTSRTSCIALTIKTAPLLRSRKMTDRTASGRAHSATRRAAAFWRRWRR